MSSRSFLLLQGVASPFFRKLCIALKKQGHQVTRINFCGGDWLISRQLVKRNQLPKQLNFRQPLNRLPTYIESIFNREGITDIVLFGDMRPVHRAAIALARKRDLQVHVFEEGYLRPGWITLEKNGVNANSNLLLKQPDWYHNFALSHLSEIATQRETHATGKQLPPRAWHDIRYHMASFLLRPFFPYYRTHRPDRPLTEYLGWIQRFPRVALFHKKKARRTIAQLTSGNKPFYLLPLQLNADTQIVAHSPVSSVSEVIEMTIRSFALHAPPDSLLIIKNHPLDTGLVDYPDIIRHVVKENNLDLDRIIYLETGDLQALLEKASGTVLVNSTVGFAALAAGCPTKVLGTAIYDLEGLTTAVELDDFWQVALIDTARPDAALFDAFRNSLLLETQINGDFYTHKGIDMAVAGSLNKLAGNSHQPTHPESANTVTTNDSRNDSSYPA